MRLSLAFASVFAFAALSSNANALFSDYEDLTEDFYGQTFTHNGVTYRDVNNVSGVQPDGEPFDPEDLGQEVIVENATLFYPDFPGYGSANNSLTFGSAYIVGDNLSIGALASVWMDLDEVSNAASFDLAFYENGPWGNIEYRLEALLNGVVVASDVHVIADGGGRDNATWITMSVDGANFDSLHLYGWLNDNYVAPRGMIDNLSVTAAPVPEPATMAALGLGALALLRRRRR